MTLFPQIRKFEGERFVFDTQHRDKSSAQSRAAILRKNDQVLVRIVKAETYMKDTRYLVYKGPHKKKWKRKIRAEIKALREWQNKIRR